MNDRSSSSRETDFRITGAYDLLQQTITALDVMQSNFYELWIGTWPSAIDWTGAVVNTAVSGALGTISWADNETKGHDYSKTINKYFSHTTAYYFGEDAFSIRNEAYDDMLWVVLGWLESIKFIQQRNYTEVSWHGTQFIPAFSHRARLFWDLASKGWDTDLCGGGMIWNPNLLPYKNTITNQLFISASITMYLSSPGDTIDFPFAALGSETSDAMPGRPHDPKYLKAAIDGYAWLKSSNMTNSQGLYIDGYHISGFGRNGGIGTGKCDERNEVTYSYNQGVILSGLRGLWEATGNITYLEDGYELIRNVMAATGWSWAGERHSPIYRSPGWAGLGQYGILEELCDRSGSCSQDAQTFKGIFFQHLTQFCEVLPLESVPGKAYGASKALRERHTVLCGVIGKWVLHNAEAALSTKDNSGLFGMWWGHNYPAKDYPHSLPDGAVDYRNNGSILMSEGWTLPQKLYPVYEGMHSAYVDQNPGDPGKTDTNDRGRGRTVETQQGGLAVLRSAWELLDPPWP